jgi:hypothetical protein
MEVGAHKTSLDQSFFIELIQESEWSSICVGVLATVTVWLIIDWLTNSNLFDWLHLSMTNTIRHYLDNGQSIDQFINDVLHMTDSFI